MDTIPFELKIRRSGKDVGTETVLCRRSLRVIADNREVFDAQWKDREVIVKVFSRGLVSRIRFKREWGGLVEHERRGISAPKILFYGETADVKRALVLEKIGGSQTMEEIFSKASTEKRIELLIMVCREMAGQHEKGILQKDTHLGNFLWDGNQIFSIDPAQTRFLSRPAEKKESIAQLVLLTSNIQGEEEK